MKTRIRIGLLSVVVVAITVGLLTAPSSLAGEMRARSVTGTSVVNTDLSTLQQAIDRSDVQTKLIESGINPIEARDRLATLSPADMHEAAQQVERAGTGGDALGFVIAVLVIVLLVLLILALIGKL